MKDEITRDWCANYKETVKLWMEYCRVHDCSNCKISSDCTGQLSRKER